jgi:hypothetical protein
MTTFITITMALITFPSENSQSPAAPTVIVVVGAEGTEQYGKAFSQWADRWESAAKAGDAKLLRIGPGTKKIDSTDREKLKALLKKQTKHSDNELWIVLIGHGTFDGRDARFNLSGPDVSAGELANWLTPFTRPVALINCASSSGPFINRLSAKGRVIVTATKNGHEQNYARFGDYLSQAIADPKADLDKDDQTSLLEAWLTASRKTEEFYKTEARLATEHSLLDDNGDQLGTRTDFFQGVRPVKKAADGGSVDGYRAHQFHLVRSETERNMPSDLRRQRDELELQVIQLRDLKAEFTEDEYYQKLEAILLQLATLYEEAESSVKQTAKSS